MTIKLFKAAREACRGPEAFKNIREHTTGAEECYGKSEAEYTIPHLQAAQERQRQVIADMVAPKFILNESMKIEPKVWGALKHIRTIERGEIEQNGLKWDRFTSYYKFEKLPLWQRIKISLRIWWTS